LGRAFKKAKTALPDRFKDVGRFSNIACFLGGWKACVRTEGSGVIAIFTLPRILVSQSAGQAVACLMDDCTPRFRLADVLAVAGSSTPPDNRPLKLVSVTDEPKEIDYLHNIRRVLNEIGGSDTMKTVITRRRNVRLAGAPNPLETSWMLADRYEQVYDFHFRWNGGKSWFGVSPEVLMQKHGRSVFLRPLAGTRRASDNTAGESAVQELLTDTKNNLEHRLAVERMRTDLGHICRPDTISVHLGRDVLDVGYAIHIKSELCGVLRPRYDTFGCLGSVYPAGVIWGLPKVWSRRMMASCEVFEREFFTGGLGYVRLNDDSDFALAIRTGALEGSSLDVFAGGGIVRGAVPEDEWEETVTKMIPLLSLLQIAEQPAVPHEQPAADRIEDV
jgi:anthranilate synthase component 1